MKRIQRRRTKGWRMPPNTVYVGRPTKWGNPFPLTGWQDIDGRPVTMTREAIVHMYAHAFAGPSDEDPAWAAPLRGKDLACWCPLDQPCHADVLLELANAA